MKKEDLVNKIGAIVFDMIPAPDAGDQADIVLGNGDVIPGTQKYREYRINQFNSLFIEFAEELCPNRDKEVAIDQVDELFRQGYNNCVAEFHQRLQELKETS